MTKSEYERIEAFMVSRMTDSAHDKEHIYRVLYSALDIAKTEHDVDTDVLIAACLLHDIGRDKQYKDPMLCHAAEGGEMAYQYLLTIGWTEEKAARVKSAIASRRFRSDNPPESIEARILFDSDKLDAAGTLGIVRTLIYKGQVGDKLYSTDDAGNVIDGENDPDNTFFNEYKFKLENVYDRFYTARGREMAMRRKKPAEDFWDSLRGDVVEIHRRGIELLESEKLI